MARRVSTLYINVSSMLYLVKQINCLKGLALLLNIPCPQDGFLTVVSPFCKRILISYRFIACRNYLQKMLHITPRIAVITGQQREMSIKSYVNRDITNKDLIAEVFLRI